MQTIEIPLTDELKHFIDTRYNKSGKQLVDEFLVYIRTKKVASDLSRALKETKEGKTQDISDLINAL
ncbi:MAG: hypothetical protein L3J47_10325 [Sulfurovum sp.]|nr:hypothetical protein [Sulfurovum sp.]